MGIVRRRPTSGRARAVLLAGAGAAAATAALAAPAGALAAPSIAVSAPCLVNVNPLMPPVISVVGTGWTAGDDIDLSGSDDLDGDATVAADGSFATTVEGDDIADGNAGVANVSLTATDEGPSGTGTATVAFQLANLAVSVNPSEAAFTKRVTYSFSGFAAGKPIYAHYIHKGKVVARQKFGIATGDCGVLNKKRALQYPGGHPKYDKYTVQFDDSAHYSKKSTPRVLYTLEKTVF
jgi:hypothetical protein